MADEAVDLRHFRRAVEIYRGDPVPWVLLYGAVLLVGVVTFGLGLVLLPNAFRATREALAESRAPDLARLGVFDHLVEDAIVMAALVAATVMISTFLGPFAPVIVFLLGLGVPIVADNRYTALDALRLSVAVVTERPVPAAVHAVASTVILIPASLCCLLPLPLLLPIVGIATWLDYDDQRELVDTLARQQGVRQLQDR